MPPQHPFPVNCKQLLYLADMGYIHLPTIKPEDIEMRNKSDSLARTITITQVLWFTLGSYHDFYRGRLVAQTNGYLASNHTGMRCSIIDYSSGY
ncbi:hypothetical protein LMH87_003320 [Akanthomyces muscarius]|uniref:Uncharacterized protein n=1 Tax=Akanthomyces muscarius TaxID=2231603 RepID=A0A9W8Q1U9_AKAMU|nr:hypothetical protein LMH87_003320 [Akanthomyces muscarius]KAJ4144438.1 hypothetical protein LMH87_003320 [Akanthomyces muscarius]